MEFRIVHPYPVNCKQNQDIIRKLKNYKLPDFPDVYPGIAIPILGDINVEEVLKKHRLHKPQGKAQAKDSTDPTNSNEKETNHSVEEPSTQYVELDRFLPKNRHQYKTTVALQGCPLLKRAALEKVIRLILSTLPSKGSFLWTESPGRDLAESCTIFVRLSSVHLAEAFCGILPKFLKALNAELSSVVEPVVPEDIKTETVDEVVLEVSSIVTNKNNHGDMSERTGTEDLDKVMQHYSTYQVDNADLVDIPRDMKEKVVKEVIRFRSRVLNIEKEARKKDFESERKKAKAKLSNIFQNIKEAGPSASTNVESKDVEMENEEEDEKVSEIDKLSEEDYLAFIEKDRLKKEEEIYSKKLQRIRNLEANEMVSILSQLQVAEEYEENLMDNKFSFLEEFKSFSDLENPKINPLLSSKLQLYYNDHAEYLRIRNSERTKEEDADKADALDESESIIPESGKLPETSKLEKVAVLDHASIKVADFSDGVLSALREKIGDLIEEYLGIKEDVLIEYVFDYVVKNNLDERDALIEELQETLDDDSKIVVESIYDFITAAYNGSTS